MEKRTVYFAQCFTGAHCFGCYSTLEDAQNAIHLHAAILTNHSDIHLEMHWQDTLGNGIQMDWVANNPIYVGGPCGVLSKMENPVIYAVQLDAPLPMV